jgi:hypothetical protein
MQHSVKERVKDHAAQEGLLSSGRMLSFSLFLFVSSLRLRETKASKPCADQANCRGSVSSNEILYQHTSIMLH